MELIAAVGVAQRTFGVRAIGLARLPRLNDMSWSGALLAVRLVPWLLLIPLQGMTHDPLVLLSAFAYFLLFNPAAEEGLFRGLLLQGILALGAGVPAAATPASSGVAAVDFG